MISPAREGGAPALRALVRAAYAHCVPRIGMESLPMVDGHAARIAASQAWALDHEGVTEGVLVLEETPDGMLPDNVAAAESARAKGHGRAMIAFAETEIRREERPGRKVVIMEKRL